MTSSPTAPARPRVVVLLALGVVAGLLSGFFGIGGGVIVVPLLLMFGVTQRIAAGTSTAAILPTAIVGAIGYAVSGDVDWWAGIALAVCVVLGAQVGSLLLARLPKDVLFFGFLGFLVLAAVSLWVVVPARESTIDHSPMVLLALAGLGVGVGILSGVLGVGGGIVAVPALMLFFGAGDLVAKGTSLLMMVPGSVSATIGNARRENVDLRMAAWIGITACAVSPLGIFAANLVAPEWANVAFGVLVLAVAVHLTVRRLRRT